MRLAGKDDYVARVPATFDGVVHELLQGPLTALAHRTLVGLVSAFFALVGRAARDLRYSVRDLHWKKPWSHEHATSARSRLPGL